MSALPSWDHWSQSQIFRYTAFTVASTFTVARRQASLSGTWRPTTCWHACRPKPRLRSSTFFSMAGFINSQPTPTATHDEQQSPSLMAASDWSHLKKCEDVGFCRRQRCYQAKGGESYTVLKSSIQVSTWHDMPAVTATLISGDGARNKLSLAVMAFEEGLFRIAISDFEDPAHERYILHDVTMDHCKPLPIDDTMLSIRDKVATFSVADQENGISIHLNPFWLDLVKHDSGQSVITINGESRLVMEDYGSTPLFHYAQTHEEKFREHTDLQRRGPESVGVDIVFPSVKHLYGIPERTSPFSLPETKNSNGEVLSEPYRMYNLDVCPYELDKPIGLYGSVPLLYARSGSTATGVFWNNASETYVDVQTPSTNLCTKSTHWFAESGIVDIFLLPGPSANDVYKQYLFLTGSPPLPPLFALGYHQCRYSYENEKDVREVDKGFDSHNIPYDVMWLDIDHTNGKRYFTFDHEKYPDPVKLQKDLAKNGRKTVAIIDPHIKRDDSYTFHKLATQEELYVKCPDGSNFEGECWAGNSSYLNFLSPRVRTEWGKWFNDRLYSGMTEHLHVWNDMNEPAVFEGPEGTMPKDVLHDGVEHRHVHNIFGYSMARATYEGLLKNRPNQRPFVLSRSFFGGTQRFAAVWTADNSSSWAHLRSTVQMVTSLQICGMALSGADVGGFLGNPSGELTVRWYQAAAFQPFFRGHSNKGTNRREPWVFGEEITACLRQAIRARYEFLTYWYMLFASLVGDVGIANRGPPMRPVWWEFDGWSVDEEMWMVGDSLLVAPIMEQGAERHVVDIPEGRWYDIYECQREIGRRVDVEAGLDKMVVLLRGGKVVPRMCSEVKSSVDIGRGTYSLMVGLDERGAAEGVGYFDDGISQGFRRGDYCVMRWSYEENIFKVDLVDGKFDWEGVVKTVMVCGFGSRPPEKVIVEDESGGSDMKFTHNAETGTLQVEEIDKSITEGNWTLTIQEGVM